MNHGPCGQQNISEEMAAFSLTPEVMKEVIPWNCGLDQEPSRAGKTILFVEDEAFVRNVTSEVLRSAGYKVLTTRNANEALAAYREYHDTVDLLLTDVILPGETGLTLAGRLGREDPELKVLFVTGYAEPLGLCKSVHVECLAKPFSTLTLLEKIKQILDGDHPFRREHPPVRRACDNA